MSEGFKGFAWVSLMLGVILVLISFMWYNENILPYGLFGMVLSIPLFIASGFCKIMEDTRDTLKKIEEILNKSNDSKEENKPEN